MYEEAESLLDDVISRTGATMRAMADRDIPDNEALWLLVGAHVSHANIHNQADTAAGYAVALHRLVADRQRIAELEGRVAMLQALDEFREL